MTDINSEHNPLANEAQLFKFTINNFFRKESDIPVPFLLWQQYFNQFKWVVYKDQVLQCWICQDAFEKFPMEIECDEWTMPNECSFKAINKESMILILKLHNFSDNHIRALGLLNQLYDIDKESGNVNTSLTEESVQGHFVNSSNIFVSMNLKHCDFNNNSENMELLRNFEMRHFKTGLNNDVFPECVIDLVNDDNELSHKWEPFQSLYPFHLVINNRTSNFNIWSRYLTRYSWLYLKDDNPGCKYCEQAFKLSLQMSFTKWTSPNMLAETVSQDRPNRTLLQHDRSKNHRIAEDVLVEHKVISPRAVPKLKVAELRQETLIADVDQSDESQPRSEYPAEFAVERWNRFTKNYPWLYYSNQLFHCTYCERAFKLPGSRMTHTSWTSSQFDSGRIKDACKARHYFYDHQRSNNHRVAKNILEVEGIISTKSSVADDDDDLGKMSEEESKVMECDLELIRPLTPPEDTTDNVLNDKQWQQLCVKYPWLVGAMGKSYGCRACQDGRRVNPLTVNLSQWTQGQIQFTKTKYIQLRKSLWCHSITRNHINSAAVLQQTVNCNGNSDHSNGIVTSQSTMHIDS